MWDKIVRCARMEIGMFRGIVFIAVFLVIATVVLLYALNRNEEGIANNLDELFAKLDIESKFANAETCGILYYTVTGTVYCQQVRIMGRFSPENEAAVDQVIASVAEQTRDNDGNRIARERQSVAQKIVQEAENAVLHNGPARVVFRLNAAEPHCRKYETGSDRFRQGIHVANKR